MLFFHSEVEILFRKRIETRELRVIERAAMQNSAILIDGSVNDGVSRAAIFGLDVEDLVADFDIGVETGAHRAKRSPSIRPQEIFDDAIIREFI
jgi:hypothetical protein